MLTTEALTETINQYRTILEAHAPDKEAARIQETLERAARNVQSRLRLAEILVLRVECEMREEGYL